MPFRRARHRSFVRPGTSTATATQSLPYFVTAPISFASSPYVRLPIFRLVLGSKNWWPIFDGNPYYFDLERVRQLRPNTVVVFLHPSISFASSSAVHLPISLSMRGFNPYTHLSRHCSLFRSGTSAATATQSLPYFVTASISFASSPSVRLPIFRLVLGFKLAAHLLQHCALVRPGTSAATATQSLPCFFTPLAIFASSSGVHLPFFRLVLGFFKNCVHLSRHSLLFQPGIIAAIATQLFPCFATPSVSFASASAVHLRRTR
jgi:hypothetical protein